MEQQGTKCVDLVGAGDKQLITAVFVDHLLMIFCRSKSFMQARQRGVIHTEFPPDWDITHLPKHWSMKLTKIQYIQNIIIPYANKTRETFEDDTPALVIMDNFKGQITSTVTKLLEQNNIHCLQV